jgi:L-ascorbate metabolism protein UlaG (beta-lactamase superfamily)
MRTILPLLLVVPMAFVTSPPPDKIPATGGDITIAPLNHATLQLVWAGHVIDVDPVGQADYTGLAAPDIILITDIHGDHLDPATIAKVRKPATKIVAPAAAAPKLDSPIVMANGETKTVDGLTIAAVPMYNLTRGPAAGQLYHEKGRGNGYVVTLGGKRIYIAGDTEGTPEMRALKNIDVAFVPMNLPYTMTPAEAADAVKAFAPKIVYPYHYRGQDTTEFAKALAGTGIDVRLRNWY